MIQIRERLQTLRTQIAYLQAHSAVDVEVSLDILDQLDGIARDLAIALDQANLIGVDMEQVLATPAVVQRIEQVAQSIQRDRTARSYVWRLLRSCWYQKRSTVELARAWGSPDGAMQRHIYRAARSLETYGLLIAVEEGYRVNMAEIERLSKSNPH
ncbi:MAG: hypothetical protein ACLFVO_13840 [Chloroflexaceae bacterium]